MATDPVTIDPDRHDLGHADPRGKYAPPVPTISGPVPVERDRVGVEDGSASAADPSAAKAAQGDVKRKAGVAPHPGGPHQALPAPGTPTITHEGPVVPEHDRVGVDDGDASAADKAPAPKAAPRG